MKKFYYFVFGIVSIFIFNNNILAYEGHGKTDYGSYSLSELESTYNVLKNYSDSYDKFFSYCYNSMYNNLFQCFYYGDDLEVSVSWNSNSRSYVLKFSGTRYRLNSDGTILNNSSSYTEFLYFSGSASSSPTVFPVAYVKNVLLPDSIDFIDMINTSDTYLSDYLTKSDYNYFYKKNDINFRGVLNILFEESRAESSYIVNYYFNDELDSSISYNGTGYIGDEIEIINKSTDRYNIDNNNYIVSLIEEYNVFNIYYYDVYYGTDYELINTFNTSFRFPFSMNRIQEVFIHINFNRFTQFQQFVICLGVNILFIIFIFFLAYFIIRFFGYIIRMF